MSSLNYKNGLGLALVLSIGLSGCSSSTDSTGSTLTGIFADAPVQGIHYQTATQSGFTDANGHFKYVAGEEVEFKLGNLSLGKGPAGGLVTPYTISDNNDTATNIALLLQNFDGNRSNSGTLDLSKLQDFNFTLSDFNLSATPATMKGKVQEIFAVNSFVKFRDDTNNTILDETEVKTAMDNFIAAKSVENGFTQDLISGKTFYPTGSYMEDPIKNKLVFESNGVLHAYHSYYKDDANGNVYEANEPWGEGQWIIQDGKLKMNFGEGTLYQFTLTNATRSKYDITTKMLPLPQFDSLADEVFDMDTQQFQSLYFNPPEQ